MGVPQLPLTLTRHSRCLTVHTLMQPVDCAVYCSSPAGVCRDSGMLQLNELAGAFAVPEWMLEKMRCQMRLMRTDVGHRPSKLLHDSTPVVSSQVCHLTW